MNDKVVGNYLRTHRKRAGLTQRELALILGQPESNVGRHERSRTLPPFLTALSYEAIFQEPLSSIFSGAYGTVAKNIETNLAEFERKLESTAPNSRDGGAIAQKLQWLKQRHNAV